MPARLTPDVLDDEISESKLRPSARHLFRAVMTRHDWDTGEIPAHRALSLTDMQHRTGHARRTVRDDLFLLQEEGWVSRLPPPEDRSRREHQVTRMWIHLPGSPLMLKIRQKLTGPDHRARRRAHQARQARWRAEIPDWAASPAMVALAAQTLTHLNGGRQVGEATARAAVATVLGGRARGDFRGRPERYLTAALEREPARFLPTPVPPPVTSPTAGEPAPGTTEAGAARARELLAEKARTKPPP